MQANENAFIVSVMASDRVGIIADVAGAISAIGGNLEDVSQTVMRGYFTMIMLAELPGGSADAAELDKRLRAMASLQDAAITVAPYRPMDEGSGEGDAASIYVLTASGPDQPGIVAQFAQYLKERGINIVDLSSCNAESLDYTMVWLISIPREINVRRLQEQLTQDLAPLKMKIGIRHRDIFRRTNEI